jgi:hypothetical protein
MNFEIVVRQVEKGKVIRESLIKEIQVSEPKSSNSKYGIYRSIKNILW